MTVCLFWPRAAQVVGLLSGERGRFLPTAPSNERASDIPVASPSSALDEPGLRRRILEREEAAETTVTACS
jgi:hypothetical protein